LGFLLRIVWSAPVTPLWRLAAWLRSDCSGLLSSVLSRSRSGQTDPGAAAIFLHADGIFAGDLSAWGSAVTTGKAAQPVSTGAVALSSFDQSLDLRSRAARSQS